MVLQTAVLQQFLEHFAGILRSSQLGIKHLVGSIGIIANTDKIRGPDFTELFVNLKIGIRKERKGDVIGFFKMVDLEFRIADTDTD